MMCGKKYGNYMATLYIITKCLYLINAVAQLFILNAFLSTDFHVYGFQILQALYAGEDWPAARIFPRTTMCDFEVRALGTVHKHTVQCVLSINFFNEKIYLIVWFWLVLLSLITAVSLLVWIVRIVYKQDQVRYIERHLRHAGKMRKSEDPNNLIEKFVRDYMRQDGVVVVRIMNSNVDSIIVSDFVGEMWDNFLIDPKIGYKPITIGDSISEETDL